MERRAFLGEGAAEGAGASLFMVSTPGTNDRGPD
jgi:hypothetical protein